MTATFGFPRTAKGMAETLGSVIKGYSITTIFGAIGFLSSIVTLFVDTSAVVSVKWLLLVILISMYVAVILSRYAYLVKEKAKPAPSHENPIRYAPELGVFVIKRNELFLSNILVGCYWQQDGLEQLAYVGVVHHVQDLVIQIRIQLDLQVLANVPAAPDELKMLEIRPVVPFAALQHLSNTRQES